MANPIALVTGASSGIGLEFARQLAAGAHDVALVARSQDKLDALAHELETAYRVRTWVVPADLSRADGPQQVYDALRAQGVAVDVLINNAGYANYGLFHELPLKDQIDMIQVNITALTALARLFVPEMAARQRGRLVNVASTAAFQPGPLMAVYYATKAYVLSLSEALANELEGTGVTVTALCPGPTQSGFQQRAQMEDSRLVQGGLMTTEAVVRQGIAAMNRGQTIIVPGLRNQLMALSVRFVPRGMVVRLVRRMGERVGH